MYSFHSFFSSHMLLFEFIQENPAHASDSAITNENKDVAAIAKSLKVYYLVGFFFLFCHMLKILSNNL